MSLIHDSLRKLELEPLGVKNVPEDERVSSSEFFSAPKKALFKKLWVVFIIVVGLMLIIYAYSMMKDFKMQNENLIKDINNLKTISENQVNTPVSSLVKQKTEKKVMIQTPISTESVATRLERVKKPESSVLRTARINTNNVSQEPILIMKSRDNPSPIITNKIVSTKPKTKPLSTKKIVKNKKLSVKQTRQLINQLQILIESGDSQKVVELLTKLKESSGKNSLVYLRMNAYWLAKTNKPIQAMVAYKKITYYKPGDIQAGTNLALLEAKNNQISKAIKRLNSLKKKHPTNKVIADYLSKIESLNVE